MSMSSFFRAMRTAYQAEIDDLHFDSEGHDVLRQRLQQKRSQMSFLRQMMESSPEMVAVVFHRGFHFESTSIMDSLLMQESDELPAWDVLATSVKLEPWAQDLANELLSDPKGSWFMVVVAGLEYLYHRPSKHHHEQGHSDHTHDHQSKITHSDHGSGADDDMTEDDFDHDCASADWLEGQGFDRKE